MVPITGRVSSFLNFFGMYVDRKEEEGETKQQQTYQFTKGYNSYKHTYIYNYYELF